MFKLPTGVKAENTSWGRKKEGYTPPAFKLGGTKKFKNPSKGKVGGSWTSTGSRFVINQKASFINPSSGNGAGTGWKPSTNQKEKKTEETGFLQTINKGKEEAQEEEPEYDEAAFTIMDTEELASDA